MRNSAPAPSRARLNLTMAHSLPPEPRFAISTEAGRSLAVIRFEGVIAANDLEAAYGALSARVDGRRPEGLVIDARWSSPDYTPGQLLAVLEACLEQASPQRCAFVSGELREDTLTLIETACVPYAVRVRGFDDFDAARDWAAGR